jgi:hypothetical protein
MKTWCTGAKCRSIWREKIGKAIARKRVEEPYEEGKDYNQQYPAVAMCEHGTFRVNSSVICTVI